MTDDISRKMREHTQDMLHARLHEQTWWRAVLLKDHDERKLVGTWPRPEDACAEAIKEMRMWPRTQGFTIYPYAVSEHDRRDQ